EAANPRIQFGERFSVSTRSEPWTSAGPRRAGISSFGIGGTNAHLVLEEAPAVEGHAESPAARLLVLSAHSPAALNALAERFIAAVRDPAVPLRDLCYTAAAGRAHRPHRLAVIGADRGRLIEGLEAFIAGRSAPRVFTGVAEPDVGAMPLPGGPIGLAALCAVGGAYVAGATGPWAALFAGERPRKVTLPTYPLVRTHLELPARPPAAPTTPRPHPLIDRITRTARGETIAEGRFDVATAPFLADHTVRGVVVVPGTTWIVLARHVGAVTLCTDDLVLGGAEFERPLRVPEGGVAFQLLFGRPAPDGRIDVEAFAEADDGFMLHARLHIARAAPFAEARVDLDALRARCPTLRDVGEMYAWFARRKLDYGPRLRGITEVRRGEDNALLVTVQRPAALADDPGDAFAAPALLDAVLQGMGGAADWADDDGTHLPAALDGVRLARPLPERFFAAIDVRALDGTALVGATIRLIDPAGRVFGGIDTVKLRRADLSALHGLPIDRLLFAPRWRRADLRPGTGSSLAAARRPAFTRRMPGRASRL
ncbi:MAG: polyketide synthase dehydratase domain-containing protein, partial [Myxococcales bacterium]|nr:polyketide synthase dehydratase domain-containing protein [Myxococcales bacterium]